MSDQPFFIGFPIFCAVFIALGLVVFYAGALVVCGLGGCKPSDPYFYENGMRCRYDYLVVGKAVMAQKHCVELPQLSPVIEKGMP